MSSSYMSSEPKEWETALREAIERKTIIRNEDYVEQVLKKAVSKTGDRLLLVDGTKDTREKETKSIRQIINSVGSDAEIISKTLRKRRDDVFLKFLLCCNEYRILSIINMISIAVMNGTEKIKWDNESNEINTVFYKSNAPSDRLLDLIEEVFDKKTLSHFILNGVIGVKKKIFFERFVSFAEEARKDLGTRLKDSSLRKSKMINALKQQSKGTQENKQRDLYDIYLEVLSRDLVDKETGKVQTEKILNYMCQVYLVLCSCFVTEYDWMEKRLKNTRLPEDTPIKPISSKNSINTERLIRASYDMRSFRERSGIQNVRRECSDIVDKLPPVLFDREIAFPIPPSLYCRYKNDQYLLESVTMVLNQIHFLLKEVYRTVPSRFLRLEDDKNKREYAEAEIRRCNCVLFISMMENSDRIRSMAREIEDTSTKITDKEERILKEDYTGITSVVDILKKCVSEGDIQTVMKNYIYAHSIDRMKIEKEKIALYQKWNTALLKWRPENDISITKREETQFSRDRISSVYESAFERSRMREQIGQISNINIEEIDYTSELLRSRFPTETNSFYANKFSQLETGSRSESTHYENTYLEGDSVFVDTLIDCLKDVSNNDFMKLFEENLK